MESETTRQSFGSTDEPDSDDILNEIREKAVSRKGSYYSCAAHAGEKGLPYALLGLGLGLAGSGLGWRLKRRSVEGHPKPEIEELYPEIGKPGSKSSLMAKTRETAGKVRVSARKLGTEAREKVKEIRRTIRLRPGREAPGRFEAITRNNPYTFGAACITFGTIAGISLTLGSSRRNRSMRVPPETDISTFSPIAEAAAEADREF
jgi:hypothetical protein